MSEPFHNQELPSTEQTAEGHPLSPTQALAHLFEVHNRALHSFLMARLGNEEEVKEVTQEAYARLLRLDRREAISFLRAYLFKTAAHIAVDRARQRRNRERLDAQNPTPDFIDAASPDRRALAAEELALVAEALKELPPRYRQAFLLRRFSERTPEQIAAELGIGLRMVRNYISRTTIYCKLRIEGLSAAEARRRVIP
ncbi:MAG: RNA polymerase sigma factor [Gammaproteobacteria bacterium]|nr:MAG: RNA polymerase sigma factor [Gammaproteobacteria bacterium]